MSEELGDTPELDEVEQPEKTMDDTIRETLAAIEARDNPPDEETSEQKADRQRDEAGRFAKKTAQEPAVEPVAEVSDPAAPVAAPQGVPPEIQRLGLRKDEAEAFAGASEAVKNAFIRRSEEMHRGVEQYKEKANFGQTMEQTIAPFAATLQSLNVQPDVAVKELLSADHRLRMGDTDYFLSLLNAYPRLDKGRIAQVFGGQVPEQIQPQQIDPNLSALQQQVQQLSGWIQQQNLLGKQQEEATLNSEISRFSADPKHTHFESVRGHMSALLQAGQAKDLEEAYEMAVYANPTTRAAVLAEQQAAAEAKRRAEIAAKTQEAKRAASVNVARRGVLMAKKPIGTMEETIRAEAERLGVL